MRVVVVDTGHANLTSVCRAISVAGSDLKLEVLRSRLYEEVASADKLVVPGQGGFRDCLAGIRDAGLEELLRERVRAGVHYLGICLGLQALFDSSEEAPQVAGLSVFAGTNRLLQGGQGIKIPHMGWNQLRLQHGGHPVLRAAGGEQSWVYFVHSYHAQPTDPSLVLADCEYGPNTVTAAVGKDNVLATQFHPEKSQAVGQKLLRGFLDW